ncbi:MAG TPA: cupredoxin family copper-binding protein [Vulgatibacter sp.]
MPTLSGFSRAAAFVLATVVLSALPAASAAPTAETGAGAAPRVHTVKIKGMAFEPATLEVSVGDTVVWVNEDLVPHTATAIVDGVAVFDSGVFPANASWKYVATKSGTIPYVCVLHPTMKATLVVR